MSTKTKQDKYRPVLTEQQISYILAITKKDIVQCSTSSVGYTVLASLAPFQAKIAAKAISAAYAIQAPLSAAEKQQQLLDSLGGSNPASTVASTVANTVNTAISTPTLANTATPSYAIEELLVEEYASKEDYWAACYYKLTDDANGIAGCTLREIEAANEYRYINDMMSPEEEANWENK
jgi:hypothetical protein